MSDGVEDEWHESVTAGQSDPGPWYDPHGPLRRLRRGTLALSALLLVPLALAYLGVAVGELWFWSTLASGVVLVCAAILWATDLVAVWI